MSGVRIRPGTAADGELLADLVTELAVYEKLAPPDNEARERLALDAFGATRRVHVLFAEDESGPLGYALYLFTYSTILARPTLWLEDLFVRPSGRKRGAGAALFRAVAAEAVALKCGRMEWAVLKWNRMAIDFYDGIGAWSLDEWQTYRLDGDKLRTVAAGGRA